MLTRKDFKQIARWHGYTLVIKQEYDATAIGKRKSFDFVYLGWEGSKYLYRVDWFYNLQFKCRFMKDVLELFNRIKDEKTEEEKGTK